MEMELKELRDNHFVAWMVVSHSQTASELRRDLELLEDYLERPHYAICRDDFLAGVEYCRGRLAALPPAPPEPCAACGAVR